MDVHKNYLQVAVLDEKGKVVNNSRVDNNLIKVNEFFDRLHPGNNTKVVMESLDHARIVGHHEKQFFYYLLKEPFLPYNR